MELSDPNAPPRLQDLGSQDLEPKDLEAYCPQRYLCVFNNIRYNVGTTNGTHLNFFTCGNEWDLGRVAYPKRLGGGYWNDKVSSIINNQDGSAVSYFYNYRGANNWQQILQTNPQTHRADLRVETINDVIDGVHVCGRASVPWHPNYPR